MKGLRTIAKVLIFIQTVLILQFTTVHSDSNTQRELLLNPSFTTDQGYWSLWREGTAKVNGARDTTNYDSAPAGYRIDCSSKGVAFFDAQFFTAGFKVEAGKKYKFTFKAKSQGGTAAPLVCLMKASTPWTSYAPGKTVTIGQDWSTQEIYFISNATDSNARITLFLGNKMVDGSKLFLDTFSFTEVIPTPTQTVTPTNTPVTTPAPIIITEENDGQTFYASVGQEVKISVKNHDKFLWNFISRPDGKVLSEKGYSCKEIGKDESGYSLYSIVWTYAASGIGQTEIKLENCYYTGSNSRVYSFKVITGDFTPTVAPTNTFINCPSNAPTYTPPNM